MPKPRTQVPTNVVAGIDTSNSKESSKSITSPNRKKPIPEPRSALNSSQITSPTQEHKLPHEKIAKCENNGISKSHHLSSSSITKTLKNYLPEVPKPGTVVQPVPTSEFQSFRRFSKSTSVNSSLNKADLINLTNAAESLMTKPLHQSNKYQPQLQQRHETLKSTHSEASSINNHESASKKNLKPESPKNLTTSKGKSASHLPEYVNTTPPAVPARNPPYLMPNSTSHGQISEEQVPIDSSFVITGTTRKPPSEILQHSKQPSSRRFSGDYASIPTSESFDGSSHVTPVPPAGRRSSAGSGSSHSSKEHATVGRRSSNPLPPPPLPPMVSSIQSPIPSSFPYYVSDVYKEEASIQLSHEIDTSTISSSSNYPEFATSLSNEGAPSNINSAYNHNSKIVRNISSSSPPTIKPSNPELPPPFTPCTYSVQNINQGNLKLSKKGPVKKS